MFLNLGTRAAIQEAPGLVAAKPTTHVEAMELEYVPAHLIVVGAGYVGLKPAQAMRTFGARVTVIERGPQVAREGDPDIAAAFVELSATRGDCTGSPQFTHAAYDDFRVVHANLTGGNRSIRHGLIPLCIQHIVSHPVAS